MSVPAERATGPALPPLALAAAIACAAGVAALANCSLLAGLYKTYTNGLFSILLQLAVAEVVLAVSISSEIWSYNSNGDWIFGSWGCIVYRGLNVFASIASSYLISTIALHTLAVVNLEEKALIRRNRRNDQEDDEEIRSSRHSLVAASDSSTPPRTMNLDYRDRLLSIPIIQPTVFVWVLSLSLSIPDFTLATTVEQNSDVTICTIVDSSQRLHLYSVLALLNLILPTLLTLVSLSLVIFKLRSKKRILLDQCESSAALKLSLWLIIVYVVLCVPRFVFIAHNIYTTSVRSNETYVIDPVQNSIVTLVGLVLSISCFIFIIVRPIICILLLPSVRKVLTNGHRNIANV